MRSTPPRHPRPRRRSRRRRVRQQLPQPVARRRLVVDDERPQAHRVLRRLSTVTSSWPWSAPRCRCRLRRPPRAASAARSRPGSAASAATHASSNSRPPASSASTRRRSQPRGYRQAARVTSAAGKSGAVHQADRRRGRRARPVQPPSARQHRRRMAGVHVAISPWPARAGRAPASRSASPRSRRHDVAVERRHHAGERQRRVAARRPATGPARSRRPTPPPRPCPKTSPSTNAGLAGARRRRSRRRRPGGRRAAATHARRPGNVAGAGAPGRESRRRARVRPRGGRRACRASGRAWPEALAVDRLQQVVGGLDMERLHREALVGGGEDDERARLGQRGGQLGAALGGHLDVEEHHVGPRRDHARARRRCRPRRPPSRRRLPEQRAQPGPGRASSSTTRRESRRRLAVGGAARVGCHHRHLDGGTVRPAARRVAART